MKYLCQVDASSGNLVIVDSAFPDASSAPAGYVALSQVEFEQVKSDPARLSALGTPVFGRVYTTAEIASKTKTELAKIETWRELDAIGNVYLKYWNGSQGVKPGGGGFAGFIFADEYGVVADGIADDTVAFQNGVNAAQAQRKCLLFSGIVKLAGKLKIAFRFGWGIRGAGSRSSILRQTANNTSILAMGDGSATGAPAADGGAYGWIVQNCQLEYATAQTGNTASRAIEFVDVSGFGGQFSDGRMEDLTITDGYYAIWAGATSSMPWGVILDRINFGSQRGGIVYWYTSTNRAPNNFFGTIYARADYCTLPLFELKGYNFVMRNMEINWNNNGVTEVYLHTQTTLSIGAFKTEAVTKTNGQSVFYMENKVSITADQVFVGGAPTSINGSVVIFDGSHGGASYGVKVGYLETGNRTAGTGTLYVAKHPASNEHRVVIEQLTLGANSALTENGSTDAANSTWVDQWGNKRISADLGTTTPVAIALGDPTIRVREVALASDVIDQLPATNNMNFGGLSYEFSRTAGATGAGVWRIQANGVDVATLTAASQSVKVTWRRVAGATGGGWIVTKF